MNYDFGIGLPKLVIHLDVVHETPTGYSERRLIQVAHVYVAIGCGHADEFFLGIMVPGNACETSMI